MRWTCPKCGKKLEISDEQLVANDGVIVCPQCLLQAHQPVPRDHTAAPSDKTAVRQPPPYNNRKKQAVKPRQSKLAGGASATNPSSAKTPPTSAKKQKRRKKKKKSAGMSAWGCLGRSVVFTLVLFAAYVFFGLILESLQ